MGLKDWAKLATAPKDPEQLTGRQIVHAMDAGHAWAHKAAGPEEKAQHQRMKDVRSGKFALPSVGATYETKNGDTVKVERVDKDFGTVYWKSTTGGSKGNWDAPKFSALVSSGGLKKV